MGIFTFHNMGPLSQILALLLSLAFDLHRLLREISGSLAALLVANCLCLFFCVIQVASSGVFLELFLTENSSLWWTKLML